MIGGLQPREDEINKIITATNFYDILELTNNASNEEIKKAYKKMALKYHPDRSELDEAKATDIFQKLNQAHETLSDSDNKKRYDEQFKSSINTGYRTHSERTTDYTHHNRHGNYTNIPNIDRNNTNYTLDQLLNYLFLYSKNIYENSHLEIIFGSQLSNYIFNNKFEYFDNLISYSLQSTLLAERLLLIFLNNYSVFIDIFKNHIQILYNSHIDIINDINYIRQLIHYKKENLHNFLEIEKKRNEEIIREHQEACLRKEQQEAHLREQQAIRLIREKEVAEKRRVEIQEQANENLREEKKKAHLRGEEVAAKRRVEIQEQANESLRRKQGLEERQARACLRREEETCLREEEARLKREEKRRVEIQANAKADLDNDFLARLARAEKSGEPLPKAAAAKAISEKSGEGSPRADKARPIARPLFVEPQSISLLVKPKSQPRKPPGSSSKT